MSIADQQIALQIEGAIIIKVLFEDTSPAFIKLYEQKGVYFLEPAFCHAREISEQTAIEIKSLFTGEQEFNTDPEVIRAGKYDDFFDKYFKGEAL